MSRLFRVPVGRLNLIDWTWLEGASGKSSIISALWRSRNRVESRLLQGPMRVVGALVLLGLEPALLIV